MECQSSMWSSRETTVMPCSSKFSAPNLTNPCTLYLKGVQSSVGWPGIPVWYSQCASGHNILDKVVSEVLEQLARQCGLQSVCEVILCRLRGLGPISISPFLALVPDHYFQCQTDGFDVFEDWMRDLLFGLWNMLALAVGRCKELGLYSWFQDNMVGSLGTGCILYLVDSRGKLLRLPLHSLVRCLPLSLQL